jgi:transposase
MNTKHQGQAVLIQTRNIRVNLWNEGTSMSAIAKRLCLTTKTILNIVKRFVNENRLAPKTGGNNIRTATTDTNITYIEYCKDQRASVFAKEIQKEMIKNQVCLAETVPSRASMFRA